MSLFFGSPFRSTFLDVKTQARYNSLMVSLVASLRRLIRILLLLKATFLLLSFCPATAFAAAVFSSCGAVDVVLPTADTTVNVSCTSVVFSNVVVQGSMMLNISIAGMVMANPTALSIVVTLSNVTLQTGATLAIDSRGDFTTNQSPITSRGPMVSIMMMSLVGKDGSLVFLGSFPPGTSILISDAKMEMSSSSTAPRLSNLDPFNPVWYKIVMLVNVSLSSNSSIIFSNASLIANNPISFVVALLYITGEATLSLSGGSVFALSNCTMTATYGNPFCMKSAVAFTTGSSMSVSSSVMMASASQGGWDAMSLPSSASFTMNSALVVASSNMTSFSASRGSGLYMSGVVVFSQSSTMTVSSCGIVSTGTGRAFYLHDVVRFLDYSSLVVSLCNMSSGWTALALPGGVTFARFSSIIVTSSTVSSQNIGFSVNDANFSESSFWVFTRCTFSSPFVAFKFSDSIVSFRGNSTLKINDCSFIGPLIVGSSNVRLFEGSSWEISDSRFYTSSALILSGSLMFALDIIAANTNRSSVELHGLSLWRISNCSFTGSSASAAILLANTDVTIEHGSMWIIADSTGVSTAGKVGSFVFSAATLTIQQSSELKILRSSFTAAFSPGLSITANSVVRVEELSVFVIESGTLQGYSSAIMASKDSTIQVDQMSAWVISGMLLASSGSGTAAVVQLEATVDVAKSSMYALRANTLQMSSGGQTCCVDIQALKISDWGVAQVSDNDCSNAPDGAAFLASRILSSGGGGHERLVERCNLVNGAVWRPLPGDGISSLPCGRCDRTVDCFWPLTEPAQFTRMACDNAQDAVRHCPCIAACGGQIDMMCLPGTGTTTLPSAPSCSINSANRPRLQTTRTVSANVTLSMSVTWSMTQPKVVGKEHASTAGLLALRVATVAFASTAVLLSGPSGALTTQRMLAQQLLNNCGDGSDFSVDFASSPTQMQFGPACGSRANMAFVRGAVAGNLLLWLACIVAAYLVTHAVQRIQGEGASEEVLDLPGQLYWPYGMLTVPTLTTSTMLFIPCGGSIEQVGDVVLVAVGMLVCFSATTSIVLVTTGSRFKATSAAPPLPTGTDTISREAELSLFLRCKKRLQLELLKRWVWVDRRKAVGFVKRWGALFDAYGKGRQWFVAVELVASAVTAVLSGLAPLADGNGDGGTTVCESLQVCAAVVAATFLAAVVMLRPYSAPMDGRLATCNAVVTAFLSVLGLLSIDTTILTAVQAILNGVGALVLVMALVVEGRLISSLGARVSGSKGRRIPVTPCFRVGNDDLVYPTAPNSLLRLVAGLPQTFSDRNRALEDLVVTICQQQQPLSHVS